MPRWQTSELFLSSWQALESHRGFIAHELNRIRKGPINYASYILPAALALASYEYIPLTVSVDGKVVFPSAPAMAFIANISEYGTGFPILPDAHPDDGLLDICVIPVRSSRPRHRTIPARRHRRSSFRRGRR